MIAHTGKIWEAASSDNSRPLLTGIFFDAEKGTLAATDSYIMARVECTVEDGDESGIIPAAAVREANGRSLKVSGGNAVLPLNDGQRSWKLIGDETSTWPKFDELFEAAGTIEYPFGLSAILLQKLAKAFALTGNSPVVLHPVHPHKGIRVTSRAGEAIIMPIKVDRA